MNVPAVIALMAAAAAAGAFAALMWVNIRKRRIARRGRELLASNDYSNRLRRSGVSAADEVTDLFNEMIDRLRNERLRNLERESFMKLLVDASPMGVAILDLEGKVSEMNGAFRQLAGLGAGDCRGVALGDLDSPLARGLSAMQPGSKQSLRTQSGTQLRCWRLSFIQTGFRREFFLVENITEEIDRAERQVYHKVIRVISHEVNNTLGGVLSLLGVLEAGETDPEVLEVIRGCSARCERLGAFVRAYADVVKVPEPKLRRVGLLDELKGTEPFLRLMAGDGISIAVDGDSEAEAMVDTDLLQQVVVNIVKNAVDSIVVGTHTGASGVPDPAHRLAGGTGVRPYLCGGLGLGEGLEALLDLPVGGEELLLAELQELQGTGGVAGQTVDVAVVALHAGHNRLEFGDGLGVCHVFHLVFGFWGKEW